MMVMVMMMTVVLMVEGPKRVGAGTGCNRYVRDGIHFMKEK